MINFKKEYDGNMDSTYIPQYALGAPTSVQTANQIAEATARLNAGVYGVDLALIDERIFESVPKQHFKEIDRLMKLTGAKASIHGPIVDLAGFTQQGWTEENRKENERKVGYYMDMAHELDAKGNTPLNFHINTAMLGEKWRKLNEEEYKKLSNEEREVVREITVDPYTGKKQYEIKELMGVIDRDTGNVAPLKHEIKYYPGKVQVWTPDEQLRVVNLNMWDDKKLEVFELQRKKAEILDRIASLDREALSLRYGQEKRVLKDEEQDRLNQIQNTLGVWKAHIGELDKHIHTGLNGLYHQLSYAPKEYREKVNEFKEQVNKEYLHYDNRLRELIQKEKPTQEEIQEFSQLRDAQDRHLQLRLEEVGKLDKYGKEIIPIPQKYVPTNELALEKTAETVANVVFD
ncbi:MAG: hypothetical protein AABY07_06215, partial [Nanoarchaeota archaeon]